MHDPASLHLTFDEAETIAADLARVWTGITGLTERPSSGQLVELVERTVRKTREIIQDRSRIDG